MYKDASHYWPLDYIVQYKDAVSLSEATSYGPKGVFKGDGHGFMEIKLGTSALRLGEYTDSCLMKLQNCRSGLSFTFWFNVQDAEQSVNTVTLFNIKSSESDILKISFLKGQSKKFLLKILLIIKFVCQMYRVSRNSLCMITFHIKYFAQIFLSEPST